MSIAEFSINRKTITVVLTVVVLIGGVVAYQQMGRLEDPEFTIKEALVFTPYPGATPEEVEKEVTDVIEKAAQKLGAVKRVESQSERGMSTVTVIVKDKYDKATLPQVWDELRRKVNDARGSLPPGAGPSVVNDDYGDVYGIYLAVTGDGFSYEDVRKYAEYLEQELLLAQNVARIELFGVQPEVIYVEIPRRKLTQSGISPKTIYDLLSQRNLVIDSGWVKNAVEYIPIWPTGEFGSVEEIGSLLVSESAANPIYLRDIATIRRDYVDPPEPMLRFDGQPAIGLAISTVAGGNVVRMGEAVLKRISEIRAETPVGLEIHTISFQSETVTKAVNGFVINLVEAVAIVIFVLLLAMGLRSGLIIGFVLLLTITGTLVFMKAWGVAFERISLGALIIALGMLVDNAIVVTDGILVRIQMGEDRLKAAKEAVGNTMWPLLGATVVAVLAFAGIGLSQDKTGEYCRSLFQVIAISLLFSWLTAVTVTPLLCYLLLKAKPKAAGGQADADPYAGKFFRGYRRLLNMSLRHRRVTIAILLGLLALAVLGFRKVDKSFFPPSTRAQLMVNVFMPRGTHIKDAAAKLSDIEQYVSALEGVEHIATTVGKGSPRFLLTYAPEKFHSGYGQLLVSVNRSKRIDSMIEKVQKYLDTEQRDTLSYAEKFVLGSGKSPKIKIRFRGPDPIVLRELSARAQAVMADDGGVRSIRGDWQERIKAIRPQLYEDRAQRSGITRPMVALAMQNATSGAAVGVYREGKRLLAIAARLPEEERESVTELDNAQIWSPRAAKMIPIRQVVSEYKTVWEDPIIHRRNRVPTITVMCDPRTGQASDAFNRMRPKFEQIELPTGYELQWGGEYEDSRDAQAAVVKNLPIPTLIMVLVVIFLFNAIRQPLMIYLTVPLAIIGVTAGLLLFDQPLGFMAMLGLLSLSGMLIKNSIVLIDEINAQIRAGKQRFRAILDSGVSRLRPVVMAAGTTIFGMLPLLQDAFFISMAVTIMFGLAFATVLTLVVVPVLYSIFFKIREAGA